MGSAVNDEEKGSIKSPAKISLENASSEASDVPLTSAALSDVVPPHESYEGYGHWDPSMVWTEAEERKVVRKTDFLLLTALCLMMFGLQLDRGNLSNALTDNFLKDLKLSTNDYK